MTLSSPEKVVELVGHGFESGAQPASARTSARTTTRTRAASTSASSRCPRCRRSRTRSMKPSSSITRERSQGDLKVMGEPSIF